MIPVLPADGAALLVLLAVLGGAGPARAQGDRPTPTGRIDTPGTEAAISPALDGIEVDGDEYRLVAADYELVRAARIRAAARLADARRRRAGAGDGCGPGGRPTPDWPGPRSGAGSGGCGTWRCGPTSAPGATGTPCSAGLDPGYTLPERRALLITEVDRHWRANLADARGERAAAARDTGPAADRHTEVVAEQARTEVARDEAAARGTPTLAHGAGRAGHRDRGRQRSDPGGARRLPAGVPRGRRPRCPGCGLPGGSWPASAGWRAATAPSPPPSWTRRAPPAPPSSASPSTAAAARR